MRRPVTVPYTAGVLSGITSPRSLNGSTDARPSDQSSPGDIPPLMFDISR